MSLLRNRIVSHTRRNLWNFPPRFSYSPSIDLSPLSVATFTTSTRTSTSTSTSTSGTDHHAFFQQQLEELEKERKSFLGDDTLKSSHDDLISTGNKLHSERTNNDNAEEYEVDMEELHAEREALFQFTSEEKEAWGNQSSGNNVNSFPAQLSPQLMKDIEAARAAAATHQDLSSPTHHHESFSHVSKDGQSIHMVDVGHKQVTTRTARAQSKVILPPEVLDAFDVQSSELVGPKGPIFATAKIAGILAAKKTSDLIPLCHPLPLDQVQIDIRMSSGNEIVVECMCRVTHKTGVEMEALMGASVAALTIYDMVKAVSHRVEITDTKLLTKTGGKRNIE